jgi:hypothetical protein
MIKFICTYSLLATIFYHLNVFCVASHLNETTDDYFVRQGQHNWLSQPIPQGVADKVSYINDFKDALAHAKQSNSLPIIMPIGDRSLRRLNTTLEELSRTLTDSTTSLRDIKRTIPIVSYLKSAKLTHHRFLNALESAMLNHSASLSHYSVISTFYEMSNILYTPSISFQRILKQRAYTLIASFNPKRHLRQSSHHYSPKSRFPGHNCPLLNPQDLLAQLIIGYGMMPADGYENAKIHFDDDSFPPTLAINGLKHIIKQYNDAGLLHCDLFHNKYTQFLYWSLLVETKRNNHINSPTSITNFILREKRNWHPAPPLSSTTEQRVAEELRRAKKLPGAHTKKTFSDAYTILQNIKSDELLTEIDFVISHKTAPGKKIYGEIDGPHHFIRRLDNPSNNRPYTIGRSLPTRSNGQTLLKTAALLTKGNVVRMPTLGEKEDYFNRIRALPKTINQFYHSAHLPLLLIEPHFYGATFYAPFNALGSQKVTQKRTFETIESGSATVPQPQKIPKKQERP